MRKKYLKRRFHEKITIRAGNKLGACLMNNIITTFVVLYLIVLQNGNNLFKINDSLEWNFRERSFRLLGSCCNNCFLDLLLYNNGGKVVIFACN